MCGVIFYKLWRVDFWVLVCIRRNEVGGESFYEKERVKVFGDV